MVNNSNHNGAHSTRRTYLSAAGAALGVTALASGTVAAGDKEIEGDGLIELEEGDLTAVLVINEPGDYQLGEDIDLEETGDDFGVFIAASNVTLDGNGNTISGTGEGTGIRVTGGDVPANNVRIRDAKFRDLNSGIRMRESFDSQITEVDVKNCDTGLSITEGQHTVLRDSTFNKSRLTFSEVRLFAARNTIRCVDGFGLRINDSIEFTFVNNEISGNDGSGLTGTSISDGQIVRNKITNNGGFGIDISGDDIDILNNDLSDNDDGPCNIDSFNNILAEGNDPECEVDG